MKAITNDHNRQDSYAILREMDIIERQDGEPWKAGDRIGLDRMTGMWRERQDGDRVFAEITEVVA